MKKSLNFKVISSSEDKKEVSSNWQMDQIGHIPLAHGTTSEDKDFCNYRRCNKESDLIMKGYGYCTKHFNLKFCSSIEEDDSGEMSYTTFKL